MGMFAAVMALHAACSINEPKGGDEPPVPDEPSLDTQLQELLSAQGVGPAEQPAAQDPRLVELGQNLFWDKELSGRRNISCGTCHHPLLGSADGQSQSRGQGASGLGPQRRHGEKSLFLARNTLSIWNRGVPGWEMMFWDNRLGRDSEGRFFSPAGDATPQEFTNALAEFFIVPITPDEEMRGFPGELDVLGQPNEMGDLTNDDFAEIWELVVARVTKIEAYREQLAAAYPDVPADQYNVVHLANAVGAFMTDAFTALDSPFDRYLASDKSALSESAKRGAMLFYGRASCSSCHSGALQTDQGVHNIASPQVGTGKGAESPLDYGRGRITGEVADRFKFRTPSLRNIELEGPWMHSGAFADLEDAVRHHLDPAKSLREYDDAQVEPELAGKYRSTIQGSEETIQAMLSTIDPALAVKGDPLTDEEVNDIMTFLSSLTDPSSLNLFRAIPDSVPSGLPVDD